MIAKISTKYFNVPGTEEVGGLVLVVIPSLLVVFMDVGVVGVIEDVVVSIVSFSKVIVINDKIKIFNIMT